MSADQGGGGPEDPAMPRGGTSAVQSGGGRGRASVSQSVSGWPGGLQLGHGESVLARLHFEGRLAAAGVVGHAQVVEDQADVARQALDGRGDGIAGLGFDGTDGEAA